MKKLISLLAALAVVSTCTMSAFAFSVDADNDATTDNNTAMTVTTVAEPATYEADEDGKYTVDASVAGTQDQTTILAVKGDVVRLGSIEYIDQSATQSFTFALRNELGSGETVNVLVGGSAGTVYHTGSMQGESTSTEPTAFTVSGTVGNVVSQDYIDEMSGYVVDIYGEEAVPEYVAGYTTTAYLISVDEIENYIAYYTGDVETFDYVKKCEVSAVSGEYSFTEVENGEYAIIIARPSALPYMDYLTVDGENVNVDSVELVLGDVEGFIDWTIGSSDAIQIIQTTTDIESEDFKPSYDIVPDLTIGSPDAIEAIQNTTDIYTYDTPLINDFM